MYNQNSYVPRFNSYSLPNYNGYGQTIQQPVNYPQQYNQGYMGQISSPQQVPSVADLPIQQIRFLNADEIKGFVLLPNEKAMLIDRANKLVYIKSADAMGQSYMEVFKYDKYESDPKPEPKKEEQPDLSAIMSKLEKLEAKINKEEE